MTYQSNLVRSEGLEPSRREAPPPQDGVSTNSTTIANLGVFYPKKPPSASALANLRNDAQLLPWAGVVDVGAGVLLTAGTSRRS